MKKTPFKWVVVGGLGVVITSCVSCTTLNKAYWDHRVDEFCAKDAGMTIYQKIEVSKNEYPNIRIKSNGKINLPTYVQPEKSLIGNEPFYKIIKTEYIKEGNPSVFRHIESVIRGSDKKVLSTYITYGRSGGDYLFFEGPFHPSFHECEKSQSNINTSSSVITIAGE